MPEDKDRLTPPVADKEKLSQPGIIEANTAVRNAFVALTIKCFPIAGGIMSGIVKTDRTEAIDTPDVNETGAVDNNRQWRNVFSRQGEEVTYRRQPLFHSDIMEQAILMREGIPASIKVRLVSWEDPFVQNLVDSSPTFGKAMEIVADFGKQLAVKEK